MPSAPSPSIRPARAEDVDLLHGFVVDLARDEDFPGAVTATPESLRRALFGPGPLAHAVVVETAAGAAIGFSLYSFAYSTVVGTATLHLEDLFLAAPHRGGGIGTVVLRHLARTAGEAGCGRFEWWVLRTNDASARLYRRLGARTLDEIDVMRVDGARLEALAASDDDAAIGGRPRP